MGLDGQEVVVRLVGKCRCGSDDRIVWEGGVMLRVTDKQPHICLGEEATPPKEEPVIKNDSVIGEKEFETIDTELDKLVEIEKIVIKKLQDKGDSSPNPAKVGMYMKFIYELRSPTLV